MNYRFLPALSALIVLGSFAQAQSFSTTPLRGLDHVERELDAWRAAHGASWQMKFDDAMGFARFVYGGGAAPAFAPRSDADFLALARQAAADTYRMHGIEVSTLVDDEVVFLPLSNAGSTDKMTVQFRQFVRGVPVERGFFNVLFDLQGTILSVDTTGMPGISNMLTTAAVSAESAASTAQSYFRFDTQLEATSVSQPELMIVKSTAGELPTAELVWKVTVIAQDDDRGLAEGYEYYVSAANGRQIDRREAIHHFDVSGNVKSLASPGIRPDIAGNPATAQNMMNLTVSSPQGNAVSDANGNFNIVGATAPVTGTFRFLGTFCQVNNSAGAAYQTAVILNAASGNNVTMNSPAVAAVTAQANAFNWVNKLRNWTRAVNPADNKADFLHIANVNVNGNCNAFYNGSSTNYYVAAGGCVNTAYADVVVHESGHWLNDRYGSGNGGDGFGEGNADNFALYITDQPILGTEFSGPGTFIRTGNNTRQFCGDANNGCYGQVHNDGEVLMGACWKVRVNLKNSLGASAGAAAADTLLNSWMNAYNDSEIKTIIETHWLTLDDNDANLSNGTPNFNAIELGFRAQGFPQIILPAVLFSNVTDLPDTTSTTGPYVVNADVVANLNGPVTSVQLKWRINGGAFSTSAMSLVSGNTYSGFIPGQVCVSLIDYYLVGTNSAAQSNNFPASAPASGLFSFYVANVNTFLDDNFETNQNWVATFTGATAGFWQRGIPVNDDGWDYDPATDGDGSGQCYLTGNTAGNSDVDGGSVTLTSPTIDMSAADFTLSYLYYLNLTVADGTDRLLVEANNNNGSGAWTTIATHTTSGALTWRSAAVTRAQMVTAGFSPTATSKVRFTANDSGSASIVEAGVDGVKVREITCQAPCPSPAQYCSPKVNSEFCVPLITATGTPSSTAGSGFVVQSVNMINNKPGIMFYGNTGQAALPFTGGTLCVNGPLRRVQGLSSGGNPPPNDCSGVFSVDMNAFAVGALGGNPAPFLTVPGTVVDCQFWGRDPGFAAPNNTQLSGGLEYTICN